MKAVSFLRTIIIRWCLHMLSMVVDEEVNLMHELNIFTLSMTLHPHPSYLSHSVLFSFGIFQHFHLRSFLSVRVNTIPYQSALRQQIPLMFPLNLGSTRSIVYIYSHHLGDTVNNQVRTTRHSSIHRLLSGAIR